MYYSTYDASGVIRRGIAGMLVGASASDLRPTGGRALAMPTDVSIGRGRPVARGT